METTRRTGRVVELTWKCSYCGRENRGRDRECQGCGRPRSTDTKYDTGKHIAVLEGKEAEKYLKGPDWFCECCDSYNPADLNECKSCGAPKGASKDYFQMRAEQERKNRQTEAQYGEPVSHRNSSVTVNRNLSGSPVDNRFGLLKKLVIGGGIAAGIGFFIWLMVWFLTPVQKTGTVTDLTWKTSVSMEEFTTIQDEGWHVPAGARTIDSEKRYKETVQEVDYYETVTVPVTKYKTVQDADRVWYTYEDLGNGFAAEVEHREPQYHKESYTVMETQQVPHYKNVDIYAEWYWYEYDKWITIDTRTSNGHKGEEHDPILEAHDPNQRTTNYSRSFGVYIAADEDTYSRSVSQSLYNSMEVGDTILFEVDKLGIITILEINGTPVR